MTAAGVTHPDAVFLATIEGTGSALLLYVMLGAALIISLPVHGVDPKQILTAAAGIALVAAAFALIVVVARDGPGLRRLIDRLARWVPRMDADRAAAALRRESHHLRALAADPPRLAAAIAWGAANWLLDATVLWMVLAALGHTVDPLVLFIAYAVANVLGLLPITPGGVGVVEAVLGSSLVAAGVPAHLALVGVLAWRLVNYWLPDPGRRVDVADAAPPQPHPPDRRTARPWSSLTRASTGLASAHAAVRRRWANGRQDHPTRPRTCSTSSGARWSASARPRARCPG